MNQNNLHFNLRMQSTAENAASNINNYNVVADSSDRIPSNFIQTIIQNNNPFIMKISLQLCCILLRTGGLPSAGAKINQISIRTTNER
ncbi:hypothetical protein RhiirA4_470611 [Rhizophagus irregularis]|uniref:Uncharacterized protein n=1 Tax=Rhizophagus irregularis TaxID=588596 RepID=A0A2I1H1N3_9GLOM|nr:hypothetical protein RhiirA4_470611 [Rhizophagus irregularis]